MTASAQVDPEETGIDVQCVDVSASMSDGVVLRGYRFEGAQPPASGRQKVKRSPAPLLCLASELGNSREHEKLAQALAADIRSPERIYTLDMRGRGRSDFNKVAHTDVSTDADDLISFCDAHNLHHIDILVSGYSAFAVLYALTKRPGLVRKLVLNDAAPEFDAVGIARHAALMHRNATPSNWSDCAAQLERDKGAEFPQFDTRDWQDMARQIWRDENGKPVIDTAKDLKRWSNLVDYDSRRPSLWPEFAILRNRPVLLVRGEHSDLVTEQIVEAMQSIHHDLRIQIAANQGHVPQLDRDGLSVQVLEFLLQ